MAIKVSDLLEHNTLLRDDTSPTLGGNLNTNNFSIANGVASVTISGNKYPVNTGSTGQVLTTNGAGVLSFANPSPAGAISLTGDVIGSGISTITTTIVDTGVTAGSYGSTSQVNGFVVNSKGQLTAAFNVPISITPASAGLSNVINSLQVINAGGTPSILEGIGIPSGTAATGALYLDSSVTSGRAWYRYSGSAWTVLTQSANLNLYVENSSAGYTPPAAMATNSIALGSGAQTALLANNSLAIGDQSLSRIIGGVVQASGRFSNSGDAQSGRYMVRGTTISNSPAELLIDGTGGSERLTLTDNSTWNFIATVTAHRTDTTGGHAGFKLEGVIYRYNGVSTIAIQGTVNTTIVSRSDVAWIVAATADIVNGSLKITVTGEIGKTIRWVALVETVEITN